MSEVNMPRLSDTMQEGTISRWLKKPGDEIKKGDILAEIETDKATMELESYDAGVLERILVQEGETVPIGQAVAVIGTGAAVQKPEQPAAVRMEPKGAVPVTVPVPRMLPETEEIREGRAIKASPLARRMAEEHNIDLSQVQGTGPGGRIVRDDIEDFLEQQRAAALRAAPGPAPEAPPQAVPVAVAQVRIPPDSEVVPLSRVQTLIANRLSESKRAIPHFYVSSEVDMTDLLSMRQAFNASAGEDGVKVTVNDLIVKACALALEKFPEINSSFRDGQVIRYKHINVGVAVDIPSGLVVPVVRDTNIKGVRTIARETKVLIEKARANDLALSDLEAGTFSVSNLGMMDVTDFIAVINPPQAAILAVSSTRKHFVPIDGQPVIRDLMTMTVSADHRVIYGATVARFLQEVKRLLQTPYSLLG